MSNPKLQTLVESLTSINEINNIDKSNTSTDSDSVAEFYCDAPFMPINCISVTNGGNMLGKIALDNNSELSIGSGSRSLARLNRAASINRIKRKASKIFDLTTHAGRGHK
ncbi:hypothetical protein H4S08_004678 [Coemansia sp. RSA 1365]|nr:hypothetical protein H4S08_004678 [Coemansia sp. RSA 1365]